MVQRCMYLSTCDRIQSTNAPTDQPHGTKPNQPNPGYVAASILCGGFIVSFPEFFHYAKCGFVFWLCSCVFHETHSRDDDAAGGL